MNDEAYRFSITGPITALTYAAVRDHLSRAQLEDSDIVVEIDSGGGDAASAVAIFTLLRSYRLGTRAEIIKAASAAAVIALGCADRAIARNGVFLLHPCRSALVGSAAKICTLAMWSQPDKRKRCYQHWSWS